MTQVSLRYKHYDLGDQPVGTVVEIALSCINNVRLMDAANFELYKNAHPYKFFGGMMQKTPAKLPIPNSGRWHVIVDKEGFPTLANSNVRTLRPAGTPDMSNMPRMQQASAPAPERPSAGGGERATPELVRIKKELESYKTAALTDSLTKLANRRAFDEKLAEIFQPGRDRSQIFLAIGDIDHFKSFNDTYGHLIGDHVLATVARVIKSTVPDHVFAARTGGEEFAMIIDGEAPELAMLIAETVRGAVVSAPFKDARTGIDYGPIKISIGVCSAAEAEDAIDLYVKSDIALYASKNNGRNCCTAYKAGMAKAAPEIAVTAAS